ncbi:MAG: lysophospholipid acyltransferase family protein [Vicinamibacterales bacterium]
MTKPTAAERLDPARRLTLTERVGWWLGDLFARRLHRVGWLWSYGPMGIVLWLGLGRRVVVHGGEVLRGLARDASLVFVVNHRSFFDMFCLVHVLRRAGVRHELLFPVRSEFFYDHPLGPPLNLLVSGMSMFPPIFRSGRKRALNERSLERCVAELRRPGAALGFHPEGTRGRGSDAFALLPARPGIGRIVLAAPHARVLPVFVLGLGDVFFAELWRNWCSPARYPVHVCFGLDVYLDDLRTRPRAAASAQAAERCRQAIAAAAQPLRAAISISSC